MPLSNSFKRKKPITPLPHTATTAVAAAVATAQSTTESAPEVAESDRLAVMHDTDSTDGKSGLHTDTTDIQQNSSIVVQKDSPTMTLTDNVSTASSEQTASMSSSDTPIQSQQQQQSTYHDRLTHAIDAMTV